MNDIVFFFYFIVITQLTHILREKQRKEHPVVNIYCSREIFANKSLYD